MTAKWPLPGDVLIGADGSVVLKKGKERLSLTREESAGLIELLALSLPAGPAKDYAKWVRRIRLAHQAAVSANEKAAQAVHETFLLLDKALELGTAETLAPELPAAKQSSPAEGADARADDAFVPEVVAGGRKR